jgi:hypothetical protein
MKNILVILLLVSYFVVIQGQLFVAVYWTNVITGNTTISISDALLIDTTSGTSTAPSSTFAGYSVFTIGDSDAQHQFKVEVTDSEYFHILIYELINAYNVTTKFHYWSRYQQPARGLGSSCPKILLSE